jgi:AcrR family transcriptional regulator
VNERATYVETAKARMRGAILDAAYDLVVAHGWGAARMADIAASVGLSRQTLYNEFGSKDGLAREVVLRETRRFLDGIADVLDQPHHTPDAVTAAALFTFERAAENPLLKAILTAADADGRNADLLPLLTTRSEQVLRTSSAVLARHLHEVWPRLEPVHGLYVAEVAVRLVLSHLVLPTDPAEIAAARLGRLIARLAAPESGGTP